MVSALTLLGTDTASVSVPRMRDHKARDCHQPQRPGPTRSTQCLASSCLHLARPWSCSSRDWGVKGEDPQDPHQHLTLTLAPCSSAEWCIHPTGSSMLSRTDGLPAEETLSSPDCPCQRAMPRSLCLGEGPFPLCLPLANPLWGGWGLLSTLQASAG